MSLITAQNIVRVYGHGSSQFKAFKKLNQLQLLVKVGRGSPH